MVGNENEGTAMQIFVEHFHARAYFVKLRIICFIIR